MTTPRTTARTYARGPQSVAVTCGSRRFTQLYIRDRGTWETFESGDLPEYLAEGIAKIAPYIDKVANLAQPYTAHDEQELLFMVEALLQARHAADELAVAQ